MVDDSPHTEHDGSVRDPRRNPVYSLLTRYATMQEDEIKAHIRSWWFNLDEVKLFAQAKDSGLIIPAERPDPRLSTLWKLAQKP